MKILAEGVNTYSLLNGDERKTGSILAGCIMGKAALTVDKEFQIKKIKTGLWHTVKRDSSETYATIKIASPGLIKIQIKNIKYHFRKSGGWKTRFMLLKQKEEVLALIPIIDWQKKI